MNDALTKEEVLHVAELARIEISEEELQMYQVKLKTLLNQIEEVVKIDDHDSDYLIAPWPEDASFRSDTEGEII